MEIKTRNGNMTLDLTGETTVENMLKDLSVNPDTVLVCVNGDLKTSDAKFSEKDDVELIAVISGG